MASRRHSFADATEQIIGCCIEVHRNLGPAFQEVVYQRALAKELMKVGLDFAREEKVPIYYKGEQIDTRRVDFVIKGIIVELKAKAELTAQDFIQTLCYLKASGFHTALLVNFGGKRVEVKRIVLSQGKIA